MKKTQVNIQTKDGLCRTFAFKPSEVGPWPAVILYTDIFGIRPAFFEMSERLASFGYFVLLPDLFYRVGPYESVNAAQISADPALRVAWLERFLPAARLDHVLSDFPAMLNFIDHQPEVVKSKSKIGVSGYCLGGSLALSLAGHFPDRVGAAASYHGGRLATDQPDSPHLLASKMKANVYVGAAVDDASFPDDMKELLAAAFAGISVNFKMETYPGAKHGWVPPDTLNHNLAAAERHWQTLIALLDGALKNK